MEIALRPAAAEDFEYCKRLYFSEMDWIIEKLSLDRGRQAVTLRQGWTPDEVRIITLDGADIGWLQCISSGDELFLLQIFVDGRFQNQGVGTEVMKRLISEAARANQPVILGVAKINPALRLYQRLGFQTVYEDERKFYMKRAPDPL
jgi:ribosomal protein S18 acetylase RimI-like enzyme